MQVHEQDAVEQAKRKRSETPQEDDSLDGCAFDGCTFISLDGCFPDFSDGCMPDLPGCSGDGCLPDFGSGCIPDFDGCSYSIVLLPLRILVIVGLILYGDWDFRNHCARSK